MQGTGYKKCYMMAKKINTEYLPMVTEAYNSYIKDAKSLIQENESLNRTRSITEGAVKCLSDGYGSHPADVSLIKSHLGDLSNNNAEIKNASRKVNQLLEHNQSWFKKEYAKLMRTNNDVLTYFKDTKKMAAYGDKVLSGEKIGTAEEEGFYVRGIRHQVIDFTMEPAAVRGVKMLLKKLAGEEYVTELPIPKSERVEIAPAIQDLSTANQLLDIV